MIKNSLKGLVALGLLQATVASALAPSEMIQIQKIDVAGTGCPAGSVTADVSSDKQAFTVLFDSYIVQAGPGVDLTEQRKFCQIILDLKVPQGWQYSVFKADYAGFANLAAGTRGSQTSTYYFQGNLRENATMRTNIYGPYNNDYIISDVIGLESVVWSRCGETRALNLKTNIQVVAPGGRQALMTMDSVDGEIKHIYGIQWRQC